MALCIASGCATGPIRYKTLGRYEYASVEWTKRAPFVAKPFVAIGGGAADLLVTGVDTVFTPVASIPIAARQAFWGPCPGSRNFKDYPVSETALTVVFYPFWFVAYYSGALYMQTYGSPQSPNGPAFYPGIWGDESRVYKENPISRRQSEQQFERDSHARHMELKYQEELTLEDRRRIRDENISKQQSSNNPAHATGKPAPDR
jgi:hypothetical protein